MSRGRAATSPIAIPPKGWLDVGKRLMTQIGENRLGLIAAGIAFYGLLSLFPSITVAVAIVGLALDPEILVDRAEWVLSAVPADATAIITNQLTEVTAARSDALGWAAIIAVLLAFWSASKGMGSMIQGLNAVNEEDEDRGFIHLKLITLGLTIALIFGLAFAVAIVAAIPLTLAIFSDNAWLATLSQWLRWPLMLGFGVIGIAILYRYAPDRRHAKWRWLTPGAFVACVVWVAGTFAFSFYVQKFGNYNETFGTLGGVIVLLTWLWMSAYVILIGAQLDAELESQTRKDSTVGPDRPMGERGAVKADNLGDDAT